MRISDWSSDVCSSDLEHPLHDDLAPRMLEIDVDVGRLLALLTDETLEKEIRPFGIDRGDTEDVADRAVRRRSPALAEDVAAAREANDRVYRQKIGRVIEFAD